MLSGLSMLAPAKSSAISGSNFNPGRIIDDGVFFNSRTMDPNTIQAFLNSKVPVCDTNHARSSSVNDPGPPYICLKDFTQSTPSKAAESGLCNAYTGGAKSAARIIYDVSIACGINPKVLIVLLEKEQSLVTDTWPWPIQYRSATGYGCPDTAACDSTYYGFFNQVYNAARQFKRYDRDETSFSYRAGRINFIQYHPRTSCGGSNVFIQNQATAGLYNYTPYQPSQSALNNLYGSAPGDPNTPGTEAYCAAYGNRNFWRLFHDWFGTTLANCTFPQNNQGETYRLLQPNTNSYFLTSDPFEVCYATGNLGYIYDGILFYPKSGVETPVYRLEKNGKYFYTISIAERDNAVSQYGYRLEGLAFYASTTNQSETLRPVYRLSYPPTGGYMYTVSVDERDIMIDYGFRSEGLAFYVYNDTGSTMNDIFRLSHPTGGYIYTPSVDEKNNAVSQYGFVSEGVAFRTRVGFSEGNLPVYRLTMGKGYLYTISFGERKRALQLGYRNEGISFFGYPTSNLGATEQIFRLSHPGGNYLYTSSAAERDNAVSRYGYRYEGVVFRTP